MAEKGQEKARCPHRGLTAQEHWNSLLQERLRDSGVAGWSRKAKFRKKKQNEFVC